jgi:hypothetical protein
LTFALWWLLPLQYAAGQRADDDQHDGDFDQVKPD